MKRLAIVLALPPLLLLAMGQAETAIVDSLINPDFEKREFKKLMVVGIGADRALRHSFEDKFVSHLRGREYDGVVSYRLAPDLTDLPDREKVIEVIEGEQVDGAITVRVVPIGKKMKTEEQWLADWKVWLENEQTVRDLIADTLPTIDPKAKKYGVEVVLWDTDEDATRVWAGRTEVLTRKEIEKGGSEFVGFVMDKLWDADLLRGKGG